MTKARLITCSIIAGISICISALGEEAYTSKDANLRAGPSRDYPLVTQLPAGTPVEVAGCLSDFAWCDVMAGPDRGWMYSGNLEYPYEGRRVTIIQEGPAIGLPIVAFSVGPYWDRYYRSRPWYGRRSYFSARPLPHRTWVRPAPSYRVRSPEPRRSIAGRPESRPGVTRPSRGRPPEPRASAPRPSGQAPQRNQIQPQRHAPNARQARPQGGQQPNHPGRREEEKKRGPGRD